MNVFRLGSPLVGDHHAACAHQNGICKERHAHTQADLKSRMEGVTISCQLPAQHLRLKCITCVVRKSEYEAGQPQSQPQPQTQKPNLNQLREHDNSHLLVRVFFRAVSAEALHCHRSRRHFPAHPRDTQGSDFGV